MGIADATAFDDFSGDSLVDSGGGEVPRPAGVDMLSEKMKSSRFIAS
jgi:hypothetical protein